MSHEHIFLVEGPNKSMHCMIDLETVDNSPISGIASIGACMFDADGIYSKFYVVVDWQTGVDLGLTSSQSTLDWWSQQSAEARKIFDAETPKVDIVEALTLFSKWFAEAKGKEFWGNGADFDNSIMNMAYRLSGVKPTWKYTNSRCFRTIKAGKYMNNRTGTYHNALHDAITQAQYMIDNKLVPNN